MLNFLRATMLVKKQLSLAKVVSLNLPSLSEARLYSGWLLLHRRVAFVRLPNRLIRPLCISTRLRAGR